MSEIEAALGIAPSVSTLSGPVPAGMVRLRFTGTGPTFHTDFGRIELGEFDCPAALAEKLLIAGARTGDYVLADAAMAAALQASTSADQFAAEGSDFVVDDEPEPAHKRKEKK